MPTEKNEFLFTESEFEDEGFLAASFVSKYRRVTSTESLKDELLIYSNALKQQLYDIINRDYKDFITISTKLDGVDQRVSILKKPLKDLQTNMFIFHEGVLSSMQALQDKIRDRSEVSNRKLMVVTLLSCIEQVEVIQRVLHHATNTSGGTTAPVASSSSSSSSSSKRENLLKLLDRKLAHSTGTTSSANLVRKDIFICSEYERAAYCLRSLLNNISTVTPLIGTASNPSVEKLFSQLKSQCSELTGYLVDKIRAKLSHILSSVLLRSSGSSATDVNAAATGGAGSEDRVDQSVSYAHCVRALLVLSRGEVAESVVKADVIDPFVKQYLTAGRLDGKGGRGSFQGLHSALETIVATIQESQLKSYLDTTEELIALQPSANGAAATTGGVDVLTNGVYAPILAVLNERCSTMYSIAIANTLSSCYSAISNFHQLLFRMVSGEYEQAARSRLTQSPHYLDFHKRWKLDMYYSLRYNEIANRVDRICDVVSNSNTSGSTTGAGSTGAKAATTAAKGLLSMYHKNLIDHVYDTPPAAAAPAASVPVVAATPSKAAPPAAVPVVSVPPLTMTLTPTESDALKSLLAESGVSYHYSLFTLFSLELLTAVHSKVALPPLVHKFVALCLKINVRLDHHIRLLCELHTNAASALATDDVGTAGTSTPIKKGTPTGSLSQSPMTVGSSGNLAASASTVSTAASAAASALNSMSFNVHLSLDELFFMVHDLYQFSQWLNGAFKHLVLSLLLGSTNGSDISATATACPPLDASIAMITDKLYQTRVAIFARLTTILTNDCKQPLAGAVKAIAGKYRMTNKPPPDAASQYVDTILQPLRVFLTAHEKILNQVVTERTSGCYSFALSVVNESSTHFLDNVRTLLDSVKQQDSTLMRRTKLATNTKAGALTDTEKILLQVQLDVKLFGQEVATVCKLSADQVTQLVPVLVTLTEEVTEAQTKLAADK